jgi:hypothetical protein
MMCIVDVCIQTITTCRVMDDDQANGTTVPTTGFRKTKTKKEKLQDIIYP